MTSSLIPRRAFNSSFVLLAAALLLPLAQGQLPAGTRSVDDHSREDAAAHQLAAAERQLEQGDFAAARASLETLAQARPKDAHVLYDLAFVQDHDNQEDAAAQHYAAAIAADPAMAEPKVGLGLLEARRGQTKAAHDLFLQAANLQAADPALRGRAFRALASLDEVDDAADAQAELLEALKLTPETPADVLMGAVLAEELGEPALAEAAFRRSLKLSPGDPETLAGLAHVLAQQKKLDEADQLITTALQAHPDDPRLLAQAVPIYAAEGKAAQAVPLLETLRANDPHFAANPDMTRLLAHLYEAQQDEAKAEPLYLQLVSAEPHDPELLDDLGSAQVRLQHFAEAEKTLTQAVALRQAFDDDSRWGQTAEHLAFAASRNHDPQTTLRALAARATVLPNSPASLFLEATAHDTLHQRKQAVESYKAFLAVADGKYPDQEFQARHRLVALEHER